MVALAAVSRITRLADRQVPRPYPSAVSSLAPCHPGKDLLLCVPVALSGTIATLGFNQRGIDYNRGARIRGFSKFSLYQNLMLALDGIVNQSVVPLRVATYVGVAVAVLTVLASIGYIVAYFTIGFRAPAGFTTTTVLILGSLGINALLLGIVGEYLGRIYMQMKKQSLSIVERELHNEL
jgi:dolichol-phosphate mannosyltransferase